MPIHLTGARATDDRTKPLQSLPAMMTEQEVAAFLSLDLKKLRRLRYDGRGPRTVKIGNQHRVRREELILWLERPAST